MPDMTAAAISDLAKKDTERLVGSVAKCLATASPYINILDGGSFPSGLSDVARTAVQMPAAPGDAEAIPSFVPDTDICGTNGSQDNTDSIEYTYFLESKRGVGPKVCVKKGYAAFKSSYLAAEDSLDKLITQYINADVRGQLYLRAQSKFTAATGYCFENLFNGGNFANPDAPTDSDGNLLFPDAPEASIRPLSFKALQYLARYLREVLWAEPFQGDGKGQPHFKFIGSQDQIEAFRNEVGVQNIMIALASGGYKLGEQTLTGYSFETSPAYRGIAFGVDPTPLRGTGWNEDGTLALVNPRVNVANVSKNTAYSNYNPAWLAADFEVGFLIAPNTFKRLLPERYVGEGSFKFAPQLHMGELDWHYVIDNTTNSFGDYGWHKWQITRAYQPTRPHHIIPIVYRRCKADLGLEDCAVSSCSTLSWS